MTEFVAPEYSSLLIWDLGRVALLVALAAVGVALLLKAVRSNSPKIHRLAWCAVLLQGWLIVRLPVDVPWYDQEVVSEAGNERDGGIVIDMPSAPSSLSQSNSEPSNPRTVSVPIRVEDLNASLAPNTRAHGDGVLASLTQNGLAQSEVESVDETSAQSREPELTEAAAGGEALPTPWLIANIARFAPTILLLWGAGIVACVAVWAFGYVRFLRSMPKGLRAKAAWLDQWQGLLLQHRVRNAIPLRVTRSLGPMLCRRLRGYELLVPESLWRDLTESQRAAILRHELAHYRRADVWKSLAARVLALPQWFNPLAWLAVRQFDEAAEWACDQAATAGQPRATDYARALVRLGESAARQASYSPAAHGRTLAVRVRRLLSNGTQEDSFMKKTLLIAATVMLVTVGLVRLELVAREPAEDDNSSLNADDTARNATPAHGSDEVARKKPTVNVKQMIPNRQTVGETANVKIEIKNTGEVPATQVTFSVDYAKSVEPIMTTAGYQLVGEQLVWKLPNLDAGNTVKFEVLYRCLIAGKQPIHVLRVSSAEGELAVNEGFLLIETSSAPKDSPTIVPATATSDEVTVLGPAQKDAETSLKAVEAAAKAFEATKAAFETDTITLELLNNASIRLLDAQRKTSPSSKDRLAALEAYLARTQQIHDKVRALFKVGARGGEAEKYYSMVYYLEDAKEMLEAARERAKTDEAKATEQTASPKESPNQNADPTNATNRRAILDHKLSEDRRLQDMKDYLDSLELEAADEEKRSSHPDAGKRQRAQMKGVKEAMDKRKAQIEQVINEEFARHDQAERERRANVGKDPRSLRFDGRTFDQWREELLTELKPERRTEAIRAFRAFAVNGLGQDAAQAIVNVMRGHDVGLVDSSPEGKLKQTAIEAFATINRSEALPVLVAAMNEGNDYQQLFAARVLSMYIQAAPEALPALIAAATDKDAHVRQAAVVALAAFYPRPKQVAKVLVAAIGDKELDVQLPAIRTLDRDDPRPEGLVPALQKALKNQNPEVVIAAIHALVPKAADGMGMMGGPMGGMGGGKMGGGGFGGAMGGSRFGGGLGSKMGGPAVPGGMGGVRMGGGRSGGAMGGRRFGEGGIPGQSAETLKRVGPEPTYVPEFLDLLQHDSELVRAEALEAISALGPKCEPALPIALEWLRSDNRERRSLGTLVLYRIGPAAKQAVPELIKIIDSNRDAEETVSAIEVLGAIGAAAAEAIPKIEKAFERLPPEAAPGEDETQGWRDRVLRALDRIRKPQESPKPNELSRFSEKSSYVGRLANASANSLSCSASNPGG